MRGSYKGSITIETTCLLPLIALVFVFCVWGSFYYHDKNILSACAYETAVVGSTKAREKESITEDILEEAFLESTSGKCILFSEIEVSVQIREDAVIVNASGRRREMRTSVRHMAAITTPEEYIRKVKK